ncbi:MAG TPA: SAM-dependent methyltransferase [Verrucomicrobiae bacterium]|nr:SAM-dependent methyltransferase [Verrucomicrobiae bacterium]
MKMPAKRICDEIQKHGSISFFRFMELALYCPDYGYYERKKDIGRAGDFITSVSVGNLFGELLAFQFAEWFGSLPIADCRLPIVEAGAHDGTLARDILNWLQLHRPNLFAKIEYLIVEPSANRQLWQKETLAGFDGKVSWVSQLRDLSNRQSLPGILFSNELLDAFPVHRLAWDARDRRWWEWGVDFDGAKFVPQRLPEPSVQPAFDLPMELLSLLPDGFAVEWCPAALEWWRQAAEILSRGKLLAIDYGLTEEEIFLPQRAKGTLRGYYQQHFADDLLANPGEQDLTAHVNFSAVQKTGEAAGLTTELFCSQPKFLTQIFQKASADPAFAWKPSLARQFQTLTHPDHLGRSFRVLLQSR